MSEIRMDISEEELNYGTNSDSDTDSLRISDVRSLCKFESMDDKRAVDENNNFAFSVNALEAIPSANFIDDTESNSVLQPFNAAEQIKHSGASSVLTNPPLKFSASAASYVDDESKTLPHAFNSFVQINHSGSSSDSFSMLDSPSSEDSYVSSYSDEEFYAQCQVQDVVFWIITRIRKSLGTYKRAELFEKGRLTGKSKMAKSAFISEIQNKISWIFGYELKASSRGGGTFFLRNRLSYSPKNPWNQENMSSQDMRQMEFQAGTGGDGDDEHCHDALLFMILTLIHMSPGHSVGDQEIDDFLIKMGLMKSNKSKKFDDKVSSIFGKNPKENLIKKLWVKAKYIAVKAKKGEKTEYRWGEKSEMDISKSAILQHAANTYNVPKSAFYEQFSETYQEGK